MKRKIIAALIAILPAVASANWEGGMGFFNMSDEVLGKNYSISAVVANVGYRFNADQPVEWRLGGRYGIGVNDETIYSTSGHSLKLELDRFTSIDMRAQYNTVSNFFFYASPSYANAQISVGGLSSDDWEFGGGVGVGYKYSDSGVIEASIESFDGTKVYTVNANFNF